MRIASVTFFGGNNQAGGGRTPANAFKDWCDVLGIQCTIINYPSNSPISNSYHRQTLELNKYDFVFFATPPFPANVLELDALKIPFMFMIHGENDIGKMYSPELIKKLTSKGNCRGVVHIGLHKDIHHNTMEWYPCCEPKHLWQKEIKPKYSTGLLYAARIFAMKNPSLFMKIANQHIDIFNLALMVGNCHNNLLAETLATVRGAVQFYPYEFKKEVFTNKDYGFYWEVFGSPFCRVKKPRLNLSAVEALHHGMMPIINTSHGSVPMDWDEIFIDLNKMAFEYHIREYDIHIDSYWDKINTWLQHGSYSYNSVKAQVEQILSFMEKNK